MTRMLFAVVLGFACLSCDGRRAYEEGVRSRLGRCLGVSELPPSVKIGASTIDSDDGWACWQIEFSVPEATFGALLEGREWVHQGVDETMAANCQAITIDPAFEASGVYSRRDESNGLVEVFHEAEPGRYFLLYRWENP